MATSKKELMDYMRKYKKEHCKGIVTMKKDELLKYATSKGFSKNKSSTHSSTPAPSSKKSTPALTNTKIFEKIRELDKVQIQRLLTLIKEKHYLIN